jgi:hypothetical protein
VDPAGERSIALHPAVAALASRIRPPEPPDQPTAKVPWEEAPAQIGCEMPPDYCDLADTFGGGWVSGELFIYTPTRNNGPHLPEGLAGFIAHITAKTDAAVEEIRSLDSGHGPHSRFPTPGGLLLWGSNEWGYCFWVTDSRTDPNRWPVVVWLWETRTWYQFTNGGMVERSPDSLHHPAQTCAAEHSPSHHGQRERASRRGMVDFLLTVIDGSCELAASLSPSAKEDPYMIRTTDYERGYGGMAV